MAKKSKKSVTVSRFTLDTNVLQEAYKRYDWIYDNFDHVAVAVSGGKDSTVVLELAIEVARKRNRLPVDVLFIDQEGELQHTIDYFYRLKERTDEIKLHWFQIPIKINVSSNSVDNYMYCWGEDFKDKWIRDKEPDSIHENTYAAPDTYFNDLFDAICVKHFPYDKFALIGGMRAEEAPKRLKGLTSGDVYKGVTWGKPFKGANAHFVFYPLYDWSYIDIWKYIDEKGADYNKIYDLMYNLGLPTSSMRVSALFHENSINSFSYLAEVEKDNWNKIVNRIYGANTYKNAKAIYKCPDTLPYMFSSWREYSEHLLENIVNDDMREFYREEVEKNWRWYLKNVNKFKDQHGAKDNQYWQVVVSTYLKNDFCLTLIRNFLIALNMKP